MRVSAASTGAAALAATQTRGHAACDSPRRTTRPSRRSRGRSLRPAVVTLGMAYEHVRAVRREARRRQRSPFDACATSRTARAKARALPSDARQRPFCRIDVADCRSAIDARRVGSASKTASGVADPRGVVMCELQMRRRVRDVRRAATRRQPASSCDVSGDPRGERLRGWTPRENQCSARGVHRIVSATSGRSPRSRVTRIGRAVPG